MGKYYLKILFVLSFLILIVLNPSCKRELKESGIFSILKEHRISIEGKIENYEKNTLEKSSAITFKRNQKKYELNHAEDIWRINYSAKTEISNANIGTLSIDFLTPENGSKDNVASIEFLIQDWNQEMYLLMPGTVYNGNRFKNMRMTYPPGFYDEKFHKPDLPVITNDIHHLKLTGNGTSMIESTTGDLSVPCVAFFNKKNKKAFFIFTQQKTCLGNLGITVQEDLNNKTGSISFSAPKMRSMVQTIDGKIPSEDKPAKLSGRDTLNLKFKIVSVDATSINHFFELFCKYRNVFELPRSLKNEISFSSALDLLIQKKNNYSWSEEKGLYSISLGWVGGAMSTYAMIAEGDAKTKKRAIKNLSTIFSGAPGSSGLFNCLLIDGKWQAAGASSPDPENAVLVRRNGDILYFFLKQFLLLHELDSSWKCPETWKKSVKNLADAFVDLWEENHQFGQWINVETGEIIVGGSSAGSNIPAGLALASVYFNEDKYLDIAKEAAEYYYQKDVLSGYTTGGPAEILQAPDSESAFNMLESFVVLYELTMDGKWLNYAEDMARQCATWVVAYDYQFPEHSTFGKLDIRTTGAVIANAQNMHASPGICTSSGDCLLKLYRATGDPFYMQLIRDIAHNVTQYLSRDDRPIYAKQGNKYLPPGFMNERVNMSDWESIPKKGNNNLPWQVPVGEVFFASTWAEDALMLSSVELPGIYLQTDTEELYVLDNIKASIQKNDNNEIIIEVENPTQFPADVKVMIEDSESAKTNVLGVNHTIALPVISLHQDEQKTFIVRENELIEF